MKLFGKTTFLAFSAMMATSFGFLSPVMVGGSLSGATSSTGPVITLTGYDPVFDIDDASTFDTATATGLSGFKLPVATGASMPTAKDMSGKSASVVEGTDGYYYLVTTKSGKYEITYSSDSTGAVTSTRNIVVEIKKGSATLNFDSNSAQIIPTIAYVGEKITFPKVKVMNGEEEDTTASATVNSSITLTDIQGNVKTLTEENGYKTYTIASGDTGDFEVTYKYSQPGNTISQKFVFRVAQNEQEVSLKYSAFSNSLESFDLEVGVEAELPKPTVVNSSANDAEVKDVFTKITVTDLSKTEDNTTVVTDFKFTPQNAGSYRFDYLTVDAHGNEVATSIQRDGIKLSSNSIQVKVVEDYATDATSLSTMDFDALTNVDYLIPTQAYIANSSNGVDVEFPAIYAQGGWGDYSNLKLTRTIWKNGNQIATLENTTHEVAGSPVNYKPNETAIYNFTSAGSYEVRYRAEYVDAEGTTITSTTKTLGSFSIEVKEMTAPTEAEANLTITAPSVTTAVMKNDEETITFNAPTVSDSFDKNIQVDVTFAFDSSASNTAYKATKNANGTYSIDVKQQGEANAEWTSATKMIVTFKATNDLGNTKQVTKEVQLVNYSNDNVAPVIASSSVTATYNASTKKVELPEVTFNDANTNTSLVLYVIKDNKVIDIYNAKTGLTATMKAFEYEPAEEGDYAFTYVATDQNYNTSTISLNATVDFQLGYSVAIEQVSTQEYGAILDLTSIIHVTEDGQSINIADSNVIITPDEVTETDVTSLANSSLLIQVKGAYSEVPGVAGRIKCLDGDITIKAWVKDANGVCDFTNNASSTITFASKDTIAPEFKIENESEGSNVIASYEFADSDAENTHVLPWFDAESIVENGVGVDYDTMKIELFYTNSTEAFATFNLEDANTVDGLNYVVNKEGKVTAKYTVADLQGNTNTRSFIINIGDVLAPEIVLTDDAITSTTKVGETFTIDLEEITLANDETLSKTDDLKVKITLNGAEFTDWSYNDGKTAIEFTAQEGDFVISFDVTDDAGNVATTVSKKYTVKSESVTPTNTTTVWGTIMIIISLVIVGLVVFFFVKPSKEKSVHNKSKKTK